ncbi:MAG: PilW family protein [Betaproteobacteria bacterium]|nr:PilW family protein [Betaproteobacteria bacterium]
MRRAAGMSLVELLVGMAIGLIGVVIITHLYLKNEEYKRSTTAAGTAQVSGAIALYLMERDLRMAGYGVNHSGALGCTCVGAGCSPIQYYYNGAYSSPPGAGGAGSLPALEMAPLVITESAGLPDTLTLLFSSAAERALPGTLSQDMPNSSADYKVDGTTGFRDGDLVLVSSGGKCTLSQITNVQTGGLVHQSGTSLWNPVGGTSLLPGFSTGAYVFNLGAPTWRSYSIASNKLRLTEVLGVTTGSSSAQDIVDDIVDLQAEYGKDTTGTPDGTVDLWDTVKPTTSDGWQRVIAVRLGVLARNSNYNRPTTPGGNCDATSAANNNVPMWGPSRDKPFPAVDFTTATSEARCYKYRVFETVIPLRNMIWRPA